MGYDTNGNLTSITYPTMGTAVYGYDALNRLTTFSNALGGSTFTYTNFGAFRGALASEGGLWSGDTVSYDYAGRVLASLFLGSWSNSIARDSALRPHTITTPAGAFTYAYKGAGMTLESLIMPGSTNLYEYDDAGMLQALTAKNSANATVDHHGYDRDANGQITKVYRMAGITADYDYDGIGQLLFVHGHESDTTLRLNENIDYGYDASGNLKGRTNNTLTQVFTSDAADQLLNITRGGTLTVVGSVAGAVATLGVNGTNAALYGDNTFATSNGLALHDGNNLFVTAGSNGAGALVVSTINPTRLPVSVNLNYDHDGNLLSDGLKNYTYDEVGQLASISVAHQWRTEFVYDALGRRRVAKDYGWSGGGWTKTNETRYVYDRMAILQERDSSNAVKVTYSRGLDLSGSFQGAGGIGGLLARTDASGSTFYHADNGGNITSLTDSSGDVVARYLYDPFGTVLGKWGALADVNTMQFSSMPRHANSGLSLYAFRAYDSSLQRWTQRDPIGEMGGINPYGFVGNDPLNEIDFLGLEKIVYTVYPDDFIGPLPRGAVRESWDRFRRLVEGDGLEDDPIMDMLMPGGGFFISGAATRAGENALKKTVENAARCAAKKAAKDAALKRTRDLLKVAKEDLEWYRQKLEGALDYINRVAPKLGVEPNPYGVLQGKRHVKHRLTGTLITMQKCQSDQRTKV